MPCLPTSNQFFALPDINLGKSRYKSFLILSSYAWFPYFLQSILSTIVAHDFAKFDGFRHCRSEEKSFDLSRDLKRLHVKELCDFLGGSPS